MPRHLRPRPTKAASNLAGRVAARKARSIPAAREEAPKLPAQPAGPAASARPTGPGDVPRMASAWAASVFAHGALIAAGALFFAARSLLGGGPLPPPPPDPTVAGTTITPDAVELFVATDG